jgi:hypothetical protein
MLVCFPIVFIVTRAIGGKHERLSEMHASARGQGREAQGQPALALSGLWLSVYALHAAWETTVAKIVGCLSLLPRRLDERLGEDVRGVGQHNPDLDSPLCR